MIGPFLVGELIVVMILGIGLFVFMVYIRSFFDFSSAWFLASPSLLLAFSPAYGPEVLVSTTHNTVIVFPSPINEVDIGNHDYATRVKDRFLIVKSKSKKATPTSIFVVYDGGKKSFKTEVRYAPGSHPDVYIDNPEVSAEETWETALKHLEGPQQFKTMGAKQGNLTFQLTHMVHSRKYTLLKLYLHNNAPADLEVGKVKVTRNTGGGFWRKEKKEDIEIIHEKIPQHVPAQSGYYMTLVIPSKSVFQKGYLEVTLKGSGTKVSFHIPKGVLKSAQVVS